MDNLAAPCQRFTDTPSVLFLKLLCGGDAAGWASGWAYRPNLRRMISLARLDRSVVTGTEVQVRWGGFSDEPACLIQARVAELPFMRRNRSNDHAARAAAQPRHS